MTRTAAREIAVHFVFELGFTDQSAEELLSEALSRKTFSDIGEEEPLYSEYPNEAQREYISKLVKGVYDHTPELDCLLYTSCLSQGEGAADAAEGDEPSGAGGG